MSDVTKSPVTGANKQTPVAKSSKSKWEVLLGFFILVSAACLIWLTNSLSTVSNYLSDINHLEVSAANIVKNVNDATFSRDADVSNIAYEALQTDVQRYQAALTSSQNTATVNKAIF